MLFSVSTFGCQAETLPQLDIHDPVIAQENGQYYLFSTGPGITIYQSSDLVNWHYSDQAFKSEPEWAKTVSSSFNGHLWAPDVIEHDGLFYLYYSVSAFGKNTSAIGVTVNKTLDTNSPDYQWQDKGIVLQSIPHRDSFNAIDPNIIFDQQGTPWMSFGSFWGGLKIVKLSDDLLSIAEPQQWATIAKLARDPFTDEAEPGNAQIEAPFIYKKDDYYYLFVSYGLCCRADDSTYHLAMGRSKSVTGPYLDKDGRDLSAGGGSILLKGTKAWPGLGHNSAYQINGKDYLVFHAYESADKGLQKLKIAEMTWTDSGWPQVDPNVLNTYISTVKK
ncbi:arabinan endo-1,5-alpha-L-arabinosidase [Thalassotalea sp. G2M2-11]|uniref:arabinan endo-1,5-alpha-L-arabinosidase n=1 Tax=Thalassotalea sp. G2M2-11 TaxID=2787627 RepID=UPI0019D25647|nr:arabinan endo-1,5-alpha-L-arabinosidase [Thalassotalea sp. G2M2-11]